MGYQFQGLECSKETAADTRQQLDSLPGQQGSTQLGKGGPGSHPSRPQPATRLHQLGSPLCLPGALGPSETSVTVSFLLLSGAFLAFSPPTPPNFLLLWALSWGMVGEGFTSLWLVSWSPLPSASCLEWAARPGLCLLATAVHLSLTLWSPGEVALECCSQTVSIWKLVKNRLIRPQPRPLESELLRMGLENLHSNRLLLGGVLRNSEGQSQEPPHEVIRLCLPGERLVFQEARKESGLVAVR